jgi:hypothetical protein
MSAWKAPVDRTCFSQHCRCLMAMPGKSVFRRSNWTRPKPVFLSRDPAFRAIYILYACFLTATPSETRAATQLPDRAGPVFSAAMDFPADLRQLYRMRLQLPVKMHRRLLKTAEPEKRIPFARQTLRDGASRSPVLHNAVVLYEGGISLGFLQILRRAASRGRPQPIIRPSRLADGHRLQDDRQIMIRERREAGVGKKPVDIGRHTIGAPFGTMRELVPYVSPTLSLSKPKG